MARVDAVIRVRIRDMDRMRLFIHEVTTLVDEMRVMASPHADRLERALDRYVDGGDDEGEGVMTDATETVETIVEVAPCPKCGYQED